MLTKEMGKIIEDSREIGWVLEPEAKRLFSLAGLETPRFAVARSAAEAAGRAAEIGYPVVVKVVSPKALHKSDVGGVVLGVGDEAALAAAFGRLSMIEGFRSVLVEETVRGVELIVGAKIDEQFGAVILLGLGGTAVEIYRDVTMRMAPISEADGLSMVESLKGKELLRGYRGTEPANLEKLAALLARFSALAIDLEERIESIDLNPVLCSKERCVVADARIVLRKGTTTG